MEKSHCGCGEQRGAGTQGSQRRRGGGVGSAANTVSYFHAKEKILIEVDCYKKVATEWGSISVQLESRQIFPESSVSGRRYRNGPYGKHSKRIVLVDCHVIRGPYFSKNNFLIPRM